MCLQTMEQSAFSIKETESTGQEADMVKDPNHLTHKIGSCWVVTDGKAGDETQCIGVADRLNAHYEIRRVSPRVPFIWFMPYGPIDPKDRPEKQGSPLEGPFPELAIGSGRRAIPYLRFIKRASGGKTFTVCLKDPRTGASAADLIWVPEHDGLRGPNVLATITAPHRFSPEDLANLRQSEDPALDRLPAPRIAVLVGGNSRHHTFQSQCCERFIGELTRWCEEFGTGLMITTSRRTPSVLTDRLVALAEKYDHFLWLGEGTNPLFRILAKADALVVTADSTNMISEAAATGKPIHIFHPHGGHRKIDRFLGNLAKLGIIHPFPGPLKTTTYEPQDSTPLIAERIRASLSARQPGKT